MECLCGGSWRKVQGEAKAGGIHQQRADVSPLTYPNKRQALAMLGKGKRRSGGEIDKGQYQGESFFFLAQLCFALVCPLLWRYINLLCLLAHDHMVGLYGIPLRAGRRQTCFVLVLLGQTINTFILLLNNILLFKCTRTKHILKKNILNTSVAAVVLF